MKKYAVKVFVWNSDKFRDDVEIWHFTAKTEDNARFMAIANASERKLLAGKFRIDSVEEIDGLSVFP